MDDNVRKLRFALIFDANDRKVAGTHWMRNNERFFRDAQFGGLSARTDRIEYAEFQHSAEHPLDCRTLNSYNFDVVLFASIRKPRIEGAGLSNVDKLNCMKITRAPDYFQIDEEWNARAKYFGIKYAVNHQSANALYKYMSKDIIFRRFIFGVNKEVYKNVRVWGGRRKDAVLSSGVCPKPISQKSFYNFRREVTQMGCCVYVPKPNTHNENPILGVNYWKLLNNFRAGLACVTTASVLKYFELPMCGLLTFMEVTEDNQVADLGFKDMENCVYIDKGNYKERIRAFIDDPDNPKWKEIAYRGRRLVLENYENRVQVDRFIDFLYEIIDRKCKVL